MNVQDRPPQSATGWATATAGLAGFLLALTLLRLVQPFGAGEEAIVPGALLIMGMAAGGIILVDFLGYRVYLRGSTGIDFSRVDPSWSRTLTKLLGLLGTLGLVAFIYWLVPEYRGSFYERYYVMLKLVLPWWLVLAIPYFYWVDRHMQEPEDGYWLLGRVLLLRWAVMDWRLLGQHLLAWTVKGFFLPLMFTYLCNDLGRFLGFDFSSLSSFQHWFDFLHENFYFLDVALVSMAYLLSLRLMDTHFRSAEPTMLGWVVALICYQPFWSLMGAMYLAHEVAPLWGEWLWNHDVIYVFWGVCILLLTAVYVWATIVFGARFSNLSHRGIITNGPYRYTKHPAYVAKNISWWMISVPFLAHGGMDEAVRHCFLLLGLNMVYVLRAKTEEWHLSRDADYVAYAQWVDRHGMLRWLNHLPLFRMLRYRVSAKFM